MITKPLPTKLGKEPLIDVVCAVKFEADVSASTLLPGLLLSSEPTSGQGIRVEPLPAAQIPQIVRDQNQNLQNVPLMRIVNDERFPILIGDRTLAVSCKIPYAGWIEFKEAIHSVFSILERANFIKKIENHSLKYVNLLAGKGTASSLSKLNLRIDIAGYELDQETTMLRAEIRDQSFLHITTIVSPATTKISDGSNIIGTIVDIDTQRHQDFADIKEFSRQLPELLEQIHDANKAFFFSLLSDSCLRELEARYD